MIRLADLRRFLPDAKLRLDWHPDVTGIGIGERNKDGFLTGENALIIFVEKKGKPVGPDIERFVEINSVSVRTDIVEVPARSFRTANGFIDGADILVAGRINRSGSIGVVLNDSAIPPNRFGITNAHVVTRPGFDLRGSDVFLRQTNERIGTVHAHTPYIPSVGSDRPQNLADIALIKLDRVLDSRIRPFKIELWDHRVMKGAVPLSASRHRGAKQRFAYVARYETLPDFVPCQNPIEMRDVDIFDETGERMRFRRIFKLEAGGGGIVPGHSGSLLVRASGAHGFVAVGLIFAGRGPVVFAISWTDVATYLSKINPPLRLM